MGLAYRKTSAEIWGKGRTGSLDLAGVHGEKETRTPVEETLLDRLLNCLDDFAGQAAEIVARRGVLVTGVDSDLFKEDSDSLYRFVTERTLMCGKLEGITDFIGKVAGVESIASSVLRFFLGLDTLETE